MAKPNPLLAGAAGRCPNCGEGHLFEGFLKVSPRCEACGYDLAKATTEGRGLLDLPELANASRVWAVDGDALFSRPGPRVVEGVEALAGALHPDVMPAPPPGAVAILR